MAIKDLWTFRHLKGIAAASASSYGSNYTGAPLTFVSNSGSGGISSTGWLVINGGTTGLGYNTTAISNVQDTTKPKSWLGFRYRRMTGAASGTIYLFGVTYGVVAGILVSEADISYVLGTEVWVDVEIDRVNKRYRVWVADKLVKDTTLTDAQIVNTAVYYWGGGVGSGLGTQEFNDFYFVDDTQDATPCRRLGPMMPVEVPIADVTGAGWTPSTGTLKSVINTAITATPPSAPPETPTVSITAFNAPLTLVLGKPDIPNSRTEVIAISVRPSSKRTVADGSKLRVSTVVGTDRAQVGDAALTAGMMFNNNGGISYQTPLGDTWKPGTIEGLQIELLPHL